MNRMMETLEGRTMFSTTLMHLPGHSVGHSSSLHATPASTVAVRFQGTALDSTGKVTANLLMSITKTDKGYRDEVTVIDPKTGKSRKVILSLDANAHFTYNSSENGKKLHVEGGVSADGQSISGAWTETRKDGSSQGTLSLSRQTDGNPTPTPAPAPAPSTSIHYTGMATEATGKQTALQMDIVKTNDGGVFGVVKHTNSDGTIDTITIKFDANGHFVFNGDDNGGKGGNKLHVEGQMSDDKKTLTGSFTSMHDNGMTSGGTIVMNRA